MINDSNKSQRCSTKEMRRIILDMYETHPPIVVAELTGRSVGYIRCVASAMGVKSGGRGRNFDDYWTPAEEKILDSCYGRTMTVPQLARHLGRTASAIQVKATRLGLGRRRTKVWSDEEDAVVRAHYTTQGAVAVAAMLSRTTDSIKHRARNLGVKFDRKHHPWRTAEEQRYAEVKRRQAKVR